MLRISVLMAAYNVTDFLGEVIRSILGQINSDFELLDFLFGE